MNKEKRNNLTLRVFAVIIAVILWSYVMSKENPPFTGEYRNVHVEFLNESALENQGLIIMEPKDASIKVNVSGRRSEVFEISERDIKAWVDLAGYTEGNVKVPVYIQDLDSVRIDDYSPKEILFKFEKIIRRESPVTMKIQGKLPGGYVLGEPEIKPQSVYIEGARTWMNSVANLVAFVNVTDQEEDIRATVPIKVVDEDGEDVRGISKDQSLVDIYLPIYQVKRVPIELQTENQLPDNLEIVNVNINPSTVEIKGKKEDLTDILSINTKPIDINALIDNVNVPIELELPENVSLIEPNRDITVTLIIDEGITKTFDYTLMDVNIRNKNRGLHIEDEDLDRTFSLTVKGISSIIENLEREDIGLEVDLKNLEEGTHKVNIEVKVEEEIEIISLLPEDLEISLTKD